MPIIKSAQKKMRQDKKRTRINKSRKKLVKKLLDKAQKQPSKKNILAATSAVDKLAKVKVIHKNKAARIKSRLAKLSKKTKVVSEKTTSTKSKVKGQRSKVQVKNKK